MIQQALTHASRRCMHSGKLPTHMRHAWQMLQQSSLQVIQACWSTQSSTRMFSLIFSVPRLHVLPQVPNAGRGLAHIEPIQQGTVIHSEKPMLCFPALEHVAKVWPSTSTFWAALPEPRPMTLLTLYILARLIKVYPHETPAIQQLCKHDLPAGLSPLSDTLAIKTSNNVSLAFLLKIL